MTINKELNLGPLSAGQSRDILALKAAYGSFWKNPRFVKGYAEPKFSRGEVEPILSRAAEYVVRIRSHLDTQSDNSTSSDSSNSNGSSHLANQKGKRVLAGFSGEFLFNQELAQTHPNEGPERFLRDLVHATLMDAHGYVEGLDEAAVDDFIRQIVAHAEETQRQHGTAETGDLFRELDKQWQRNSELFSLAFAHPSDREQLFADASTRVEMQQLQVLLDQTEQVLRAIRLNRLRLTRSPFLDEPGTPFPELHHSTTSSSSSSSILDAPSHVIRDTDSENVDSSTGAIPIDQSSQSQSALDDDVDDSNQFISLPSSQNDPLLVTDDVEPVTSTQDDVEPVHNDTSLETSVSESNEMNDDDDNEDAVAESEEVTQIQKESIIQIQKVAQHVDEVASGFKDVMVHVEPLYSDPSALEQSPIESLRSVEKFHSTVIGYNEELLQDLIRLDDLEVDSQARQERKRQVLAIQSLMDDLDAVASKLKKLREMLKPQAEQARAQQKSPERSPSPSSSSSSSPKLEQQQQQQQQQQQSPSASTSPSPGSPLASMWERMKMEVEWDKSQTRDAYVIRAMLPGLDPTRTRIELTEDGSSFSVEGLRVPTPREEAELRQSLRRRYRYHPSEENRLLLQLVAGKYGAFKTPFGLPKDAIPDRISASYERGVLQVLVPRRPASAPQQHHAPLYDQPQQRGFGSRVPPRSRGFWRDNDLWW